MQAGRLVRRLAAAALLPCLLLLPSPAAAQATPPDEPDELLPRCGIRYPGGYERQTARSVSGTVEGLALPESGPVSFRLRAEDETYVVLASPAWYWKDQAIPVRDGAAVRVVGSATVGRDGELYLLAREIHPGEGTWCFRLRDQSGRPAWRGCGPGRCASARVPACPGSPGNQP